MAYDASFLTGSNSTPVDPISTAYHHNDQEVAELEQGHTVLLKDGDNLSLGLESFDHMNNISYELKRDCKRGATMNQAWYRILNLELKQNARRTKVAFDPLPAMESMDHLHPRELTIAMENVVTDFIKNMWEKLKNMFLTMHKKIKDWYIKAWDGAARLKKQAEALKAKTESMSSSTPRETSFEMAGVKALHIGGKVPQASEIGQGVVKITNHTQVICGKNAGDYDGFYPTAEKLLGLTIAQAKTMKNSNGAVDKDGNPAKTTEAEAFGGTAGSVVTDSVGNNAKQSGEENKLMLAIKTLFDDCADAVGIKTNNPIKGDTRFPEDKGTAYRNPEELLGGIMLVYTTPIQSGVTTFDSYSDFKAGFKISPEPVLAQPKEVEDTGSFQTATPPVIVNICENVITSCDVFVNYKLLWDKREKSTENLTKQMDQYVAANSNLQGAGQRHVSNSISTTVALVKKLQDGESRWSKYAMTVLNKAIVYCRTSLNQY